MAETSGFFQAEWDSELTNPITEQETGWWDRSYIASQYADYFKLFVGNGVFASPTNQLKVVPSNRLSVIVTTGWAFINGMWYHNDTNKEITISENNTPNSRTDSIKVRYSNALRTITVLGFTGDTSVTQGTNLYDLKIAEVVVPPSATTILASNITDTRPDEAVCGFVRGLMEIETTSDLFAQYTAAFNEWFDDMKDQLSTDAAGHLQQEIDGINSNISTINTTISGLGSTYQTLSGDTKDNTTAFTSDDSYSPSYFASMGLVSSGEKHSTLFRQLSQAIRNIRWLNSNKRTAGTYDNQSDTVSFTTGDVSSDSLASSWTSVGQLTSGSTFSTLLSRISTMMKNVRYLKNNTPVTRYNVVTYNVGNGINVTRIFSIVIGQLVILKIDFYFTASPTDSQDALITVTNYLPAYDQLASPGVVYYASDNTIRIGDSWIRSNGKLEVGIVSPFINSSMYSRTAIYYTSANSTL